MFIKTDLLKFEYHDEKLLREVYKLVEDKMGLTKADNFDKLVYDLMHKYSTY